MSKTRSLALSAVSFALLAAGTTPAMSIGRTNFKAEDGKMANMSNGVNSADIGGGTPTIGGLGAGKGYDRAASGIQAGTEAAAQHQATLTAKAKITDPAANAQQLS